MTSVNVDFAVTLSDVNQPQTITAPSGAKPLTDLLEPFRPQQRRARCDRRGRLVRRQPAGWFAGVSPQAYPQCVQSATTAADIQKCAQQLK